MIHVIADLIPEISRSNQTQTENRAKHVVIIGCAKLRAVLTVRLHVACHIPAKRAKELRELLETEIGLTHHVDAIAVHGPDNRVTKRPLAQVVFDVNEHFGQVAF